MYKLLQSPKYDLTESIQLNPIRWTIVRKEGETLTPLAPTMKCKDYFNDVVAAKNKVFFTQYGFKNECVPEMEGLDIVITNVVDCKTMVELLPKITGDAPPVVTEIVDDTSLLLHIPEFYFKNTYRISLLTWAIRTINVERDIIPKDLTLSTLLTSELADNSQGIAQDPRFKMANWGWDVPYGNKYWWYVSESYNSNMGSMNFYGFGSTIHNCGANTWAVNVPVEEECV